MIKMLEYGSNS